MEESGKKRIKEGELIVLYSLKDKKKYLLRYETGKIFSTHHGKIDFSQIFDFGQLIYTHKNIPYIVVKPNTSTLAKSVKRKTSIMYAKDMGYLLLNTPFSPSSKVIECGGGSGAFSTVIANFLDENGKLYIFERREDFIENIRSNLEKYGLSEKVELFNIDPAENGFGVNGADVVFLDVPEPWTLINPAYSSLKPGGYLTSLSPTFEQVQKTVFTLEQNGFFHLKTVEILEREILVKRTGTRPKELMRSHTGFLTVAIKLSEKVDLTTLVSDKKEQKLNRLKVSKSH